jgi:hypothetical protein
MRYKVFILALFMVPYMMFARELVRFSIQSGLEVEQTPVSLSLDAFDYNTDKGILVLYEIIEGEEVFVPAQLETGQSAKLWFILDKTSSARAIRNFVLRLEDKEREDQKEKTFRLERKHNDLSIARGEKPVLNYRFGIKYPPEGIDVLYKRSGFIHPLWSPGGEILTNIQPDDHYHHYGIWGPWTKTHIDGREVDFWNLAKGQGTVRFAGFLSEVEGKVFSGFRVLQQHIDFGAKGEDQAAINELLDVRVWNVSGDIWIIDYTTTINSPLDNGIMLDAYRYGGGIGYRATEKWHKDNCTVLTSDGKKRDNADGSFARWCLVEGESDSGRGRSGILFLSHPSNRMHPEPMRVWPPDANGGRGDLFFEFVPIRHEDWKLEARKDYTLKYRMVVFDGAMDEAEAERYWNSFAYIPVINFNLMK